MHRPPRRLSRAWLVTLAVLAAGLLALPATALATFPGNNGKLAFMVNDSVTYTFNPDGTGATQLPLFNAISPDWSPDGGTLAFETGGKFPGGPNPVLTPAEIYTANADGSNPVNLTNSAALESSPAWSPTGNEIAFARYNGSGSDIWRVNVNTGTEVKVISFPTFTVGGLDWSPDGTKIAFARGNDIWSVNPDGTGGATNLTNFQLPPPGQAPKIGFAPSWSPDSSQIAFTVNAPETLNVFKIYVMSADGSGIKRVTIGADQENYPSWSPDGTKIAFSSLEPCDVGTINPDGTGRTMLGLGLCGTKVDWQPLGGGAGDFKNRAKFCKAERARLGVSAFKARYGIKYGHGIGKCVARG
jgi:dipeptidyl aminopeptidase/acylaminoacyl peptidase